MNAALKPLQAALGLAPDGIRGPLTTAAILAAADAGRLMVAARNDNGPVTAPAKVPQGDVPAPSMDRLRGVNPALVAVVLAASEACDTPFTVIEGLRSVDRQKQLVAQGASRTMRSRHLTGHAVDLWPLDTATGKALPAGTPAAEARLWADLRTIAVAVKAAAAERGVAVEWGGDWSSFPDGPHFQLSWANFPA